jgi:tRNA pseudouridine55 synthase
MRSAPGMSSRKPARPTTMHDAAGVLPVDKPVGPTSHDVVAMTRRALNTRRVGHTGTLDPFASGLLLLCTGRATRLAEYLTRLPKTYSGVVRLGVRTDTDDPTGAVLATSDAWQQLTRSDVEAALRLQQGEIQQVPPAYSAKKVAGTPLHRRARRGEEVAPAPVLVTIHRLTLLAWRPPELEIEVACSSGTYIRSIARDLGTALACGAHLAALRRTRVAAQRVEDALPLSELADEEARRRAWIEPLAALAHLPQLKVSAAEAALLAAGRFLDAPEAAFPEGEPIAATGEAGLVAVVELRDGRIRPRKVFQEAAGGAA